uniref:Uncharacterized protein n=2 Tax=Aegilops tauschii subsp. strangulata TaxID=200361 RepID=A0A453C553_AEGTS
MLILLIFFPPRAPSMPPQPQHPEPPATISLSSVAHVLPGHLRDRVARLDEVAEIHALTLPHVPPPRKKNQEKGSDMWIWDSMRISFLMRHGDVVLRRRQIGRNGGCAGGAWWGSYGGKEREFYVFFFFLRIEREVY